MNKPHQPVLQEFEFKIKLKVTGDYLQKHDVKSILNILCRAELYNQHPWQCNVKGCKAKKEDTCSICLQSIEKGQIEFKTTCEHAYHKKCISDWFLKGPSTFTPTCPLCRKQQNVNHKQENNYIVDTKYEVIENSIELERTIRREGSNYLRYHNP